jgi:outer membrane receptor for ferrienterochelin and colicins
MKGRYLLASTLVAIATWSHRAGADGGDLESLLNETVVTAASDTAEMGRDAPATSTVITADALRKYGVRTLAEALDLLALGTMSGHNGSGTAADMGARGVIIPGSGARHFLLLVDGVRINDIVNASAPLSHASGIPLEIVDHIEVILGPGSVLYGSNAMLGVISVVTKDAKDFSGARVGVESELLTSIRPWASYGQRFEVFGVPAQVTGEVEYFKQWGPELYAEPAYMGIDPATGSLYRTTTSQVGTGVWGGGDTLKLSEYEGPSVLGRLRAGKFELTYNGVIFRSPLNVSAASFDARSDTTNRRLMLSLSYSDQLSRVVAARVRAYTNASDFNTTFIASWPPNCPNPNLNCRVTPLEEAVTGGVEVTPTFDWLKDGTFVTLVGANAEWRSGRSILNEYDDTTGKPVLLSYGLFDRKDGALAAYAQQTWDPVRWLGLNAAGRLDYDPRFAPVFSPRLAARVDPWAGGTLKLIYSQAFRAPSFYESDFSHPLQPAAVGLRPEYEESVEASLEQRVAGHRLFFGAFATHWTDLIDFYRFSAREAAQYVAEGKAFLPPAYIERNLSSIRNWGFNAAFEGTQASNALQYGVNLTAALAFEQDTGQDATPLPISPRAFGNAHVSYDLPGALPTVALAASAESARPFQGAFTSGYMPIPYSPAQLIVQATVSGPIPVVPGLSYRITGFYAAADREPYLYGPAVTPSPQTPSPSLVPIDRARATAGLTYEF